MTPSARVWTHATQRGRTRGMTLIEIMVVLAILALFIGVVGVNVSSMTPRSRIIASAYEMGSTLSFARERAIASGQNVSVKFDLDDQIYFLQRNKLDEDGKILDELEDIEITSLHKGVRISGILTEEDKETRGGDMLITFNMEGVMGGLVVYLESERDRKLKYTVRMNPVTGLVQILAGHQKGGFIKENIIGGF